MTHGKTERLLLDTVAYLDASPEKRAFFVVHSQAFKGHVQWLAEQHKVPEDTFKRIEFVTPERFTDRSRGRLQSVFVDHHATYSAGVGVRGRFYDALEALKARLQSAGASR